MAREPFKPVELTEAYRPVATPVDSFVQAQVPSRDNSLQDLARSLSTLGGSLGELVGKRDREAEENDRLRGEAAFHAGNPQGFAQGVASEAIPAQYSQAFMRGFKQAQGDAAGADLQERFSAAYDTWEGKTSTDPQAFPKFLEGFVKDNIKTDDPDVLRGLLPRVRQLTANFQQKHIGDVSRATMQGALETEAARNDQLIKAASSAGLGAKTGMDYAGTFGTIEANRAAALSRGVNKEKYDQQVVDGITSAAIELGDRKILDFLDRKVPGADFTWSNTPYGQDAKRKAGETIDAAGRKAVVEAERTRREQKAELKDAVTRDTILAITKDPRAPVPEELLARGEKVDPDFRVNAIRWKDTIGRQGQTSDPDDILAVTSDILNGGGLQRVQRAMRDGVFKNPEDLTRAYKLAEGMQKDGPALTAIFSSDQSKAIERTIRERTLTQNSAEQMLDPDGMSDTGLAAKRDYRLQLMAWRAANPNADAIAQQEAIDRIGAGILKRIAISDTGGARYNRDGLPEGNPYAPAPAAPQGPEAGAARGTTPATTAPTPTQPQAIPRATGFGDFGGQVPGELSVPPEAATPAPQVPAPRPTQAAPSPTPPAAQASQSEAVSTWFNGLSPEVRADLEQRAARERKPLMLKAKEIYDRGVAGGVIRPPAAAPAPAQTPAGTAPGRQSMQGSPPAARAPDGTPIETASTSAATANPREEIVQSFRQAAEGAYVGRATFDGTKATLNGQTFTSPASPEQVARKFEGLSEAEPQHRAVLTDFLSKAAGQRIDPAKVPWCAAFVDAVLDASGKPKRGSLRAADFLDYGTATDKPTKGDVVVFRSMARGSSGHVGFVVGIEGDRVRYIAGNDDNRVQEDTLPLAKVAGFRRPPEAGTGPFGADTGQAAGAFSRVLGTTGQPAGGYALPELKADPKAARILDLVTGAELKSGDPGNYNAIFGNAGAAEDLSKRTLDQTIAWSRDRGTSSSATGRYQFMADTMAGLKKEMGLSGSEAFTPELQDRMALRLLNRRGYREWAAGRISTDAFANALAKEWAALPNLQTGRSHYAGDGVNKALVSPEQVRAALTGTGAFPAARVEQAAQALARQASGPEFSQRARTMLGGAAEPQAAPVVDAYSNAPRPDVAARMRALNPDPLATSDAVLSEVAPNLAAAIRKAQADNPKLRIVAVARSGEGVEVWPADAEGRVSFDPAQQDAVSAAIRRSAAQLGLGVNFHGGVGGGLTYIEVAPTKQA